MVIFPNCKINLGLHITGKRPDGFHELETAFYPVRLHDILEVITSTELQFDSTGLPIPGNPDKNLCLQAYHLLKTDYPELPPVRMHLHKMIPMGAGLGGGSADGAFALRLLNEKYKLNIPTQDLIGYAAKLGSDCPFFIINQACYATGRGEILNSIQLNLSKYYFVLVNPGIHVNTKWAFIGFVANIKGIKSHQHISDALTILENMEHRGACGCETNTGDGAGIMIQIPHEFFFDECVRLGVHLPAFGKYGVGVLFFPKDIRLKEECREIFSRCAEKMGLEILVYRKVPVNPTNIGATALSVEPEIEQVIITCPDYINDAEAFERKLFVLRNYAAHTINNTVRKNNVGFYLASLSYKTLVYKGQLTSHQVREYFTDLSNKRMVSAFGLVHSRFATNTFPSWKLAQPFRYMAHNGEINTLQGNLNWLKTSEKGFTSPYFSKEDMDMLLPIITEGQSDSACLDNMIELLTLCGRSLPHVMMMLIPEAWDGDDKMDPIKKAFYEFHAAIQEPWDGPASISFTDGKIIGATLDRNGLRPSRYCVTNDDRVIMASETGALPIDPSIIIENGRLQPGKMFVVDMEQGRIISDNELKGKICSQKPYGEWLNKYKIRLEELPEPRVSFTHLEHDQVFKYQKAFGYSTEDLEVIIAPMAIDGKEPIGSMGTDAPLAILSDQPQHLSAYFKQLFAQVTNPPIDPIREKLVMSLATFAGNVMAIF
jgi:glutamate synthase (NADPH/NADH) large chain